MHLVQETDERGVSKKNSRTDAPKKFVLVELDYPEKKKQSDNLIQQNEKLLEDYGVAGYPTILLLDAEGKVMARTGYQPGGAESYVKHLANLIEVHGNVLKMRKELGKAQGLDRPSCWIS